MMYKESAFFPWVFGKAVKALPYAGKGVAAVAKEGARVGKTGVKTVANMSNMPVIGQPSLATLVGGFSVVGSATLGKPRNLPKPAREF